MTTQPTAKQILREHAGEQEILLKPTQLKSGFVKDIPNDTYILLSKNGIEISIGKTKEGNLRVSVLQTWEQENWDNSINLPEYLRIFKTSIEKRQLQNKDVEFIEIEYDGGGEFHVWYYVFPTEVNLGKLYNQVAEIHKQVTATTSMLLQEIETQVRNTINHIETNAPDYDIALSFAGEDREYVDIVANTLHQLGVKVFYDKYEEADLWGKNLYTHLDDVYRRKSKFCVMFISKYYKNKLWTNHERESAQARAFEESQEYILPARFDETEIPGMRPTTAYINLKDKSPKDFAYLITKKLGLKPEIETMLKYLQEYLTDYDIRLDGTNLVFDCEAEDFHATFPVRLMLEMYNANLLEEMFLIPGLVPF